jgi:tagatose-1,6-bisphosphate aldolase non-catalytic subunit AgaZ/GatZ
MQNAYWHPFFSTSPHQKRLRQQLNANDRHHFYTWPHFRTFAEKFASPHLKGFANNTMPMTAIASILGLNSPLDDFRAL